GNRIEAFRIELRFIIGRFSLYESGHVDARPFFRVPPHQFFALAPRTAVRSRTSAVVNDAAVARPREAPSMPEIISGLARVGLVYAIAAQNAGGNPAAACGGTAGFQFSKTIQLLSVVRFSVAIHTENPAISVRLRIGVPAVDFCEHSFHLWLAEFIFRIPPIERA